MKAKIFILFFCMIILISLAQASITVEKAPSKTELTLGENVTITFILHNSYTETKMLKLTEIFSQEILASNIPFEIVDYSSEVEAVEPVVSWSFEIAPNQTKAISYVYKPNKIGMNSIGRTSVNVLSVNSLFEEQVMSNTISFRVLPVVDENCDVSFGENAANSPDCSVTQDDTCSPIVDGICDADCEPESDFDCIKSDYTIHYMVGIVIILIIIFVVYYSRKSKSHLAKVPNTLSPS